MDAIDEYICLQLNQKQKKKQDFFFFFSPILIEWYLDQKFSSKSFSSQKL